MKIPSVKTLVLLLLATALAALGWLVWQLGARERWRTRAAARNSVRAEIRNQRGIFEDAVTRVIAEGSLNSTEVLATVEQAYDETQKVVGVSGGQAAAAKMTAYQDTFETDIREKLADRSLDPAKILAAAALIYKTVAGEIAKATEGQPVSEIFSAKKKELNEALTKASVHETLSGDLVATVRRAFDDLESAVADASAAELGSLTDRATALARLRAHLYPAHDVMLEGGNAIEDMSEWSVPSTVVEALRGYASSEPIADLPKARTALRLLYEQYDWWDVFVDTSTRTMQYWALGLLASLILMIFVALNRFINHDVIYGFLYAGAAGALLSIVSKLPPLTVYGETVSYARRIVTRFGTGLAASLIGFGFLASGLVTVNVPSVGTIPIIIERCGSAASPSGELLDVVSIGVAVAAETPASPAASVRPADCGTGSLMILVALAMLFGFSERALTSFAEKIFPATPSGGATNPPSPQTAGKAASAGA